MAKNSVRQWDIAAANNTDIAGISLAEGVTRPPAVNNIMREQNAEIAQWLAEMSYPTVGGTADALTLAPTVALAALADNVVYTGTGGAAPNATTTPTLAVSGLAAKVIRKMSGGVDIAVAAGDIAALTQYVFVYKTAANGAGGAWVVLNPSGSAAAPTTFSDSAFRVQDNGDATKQLAFEVSGVTTGTTRTATAPDVSGALMLTGAGQTTIASATTTDLSTSKTLDVIISGSVTITGFGTVAAGTLRYGYFSGALTLTYNATSLILPGAANITTANGDSFTAVSLGSGNWKVLHYTTAASAPATGRTLIATLTTTSGTTQTTGTLATTYSAWEVEFDGVAATGIITVNVGSDGGSTFDTAINVTAGSAAAHYGKVWLSRVNVTANKILTAIAGPAGNAAAYNGKFSTKTSASNCLRLGLVSGAFTAGAAYVYGVP